MMADHERHFPFERVFNFRDLGGYRTRDGRTLRWRRLFRSGELQRMSETEAERVRGELGIATVLDFRTDEEADHPLGLGPLLASPVVRHRFAMGDPRTKFRAREMGEWRPRFTRTLKSGAEHWVRAIQLLSEEKSYPAVFHCVTGKARTGVLAALVLDVAGVDHPVRLSEPPPTSSNVPLVTSSGPSPKPTNNSGSPFCESTMSELTTSSVS